MRCKYLLIVLLLFTAGCTAYQSGRNSTVKRTAGPAFEGQLALPQSVSPPAEIQSLQLHPQDSEDAPPVFSLHEPSTPLVLTFDNLGSDSRQFRISVSHRNKIWEESPISPATYMGSFYETTFGGGQRSFTQNPAYMHYSYTFPNERIKITKSGNYLLSVYEYQSNDLLFRIPFFVTENIGELQTRIESLFAQRSDGRTAAQPFSVYRYPDFVQQPQFNLSFFYVQNQFWGRARQTDRFDTATPGEVHFNLERDEAFLADYEFNMLDLQTLQADGRQITEFQPGPIPPVVTLRRDIQAFEPVSGRFPNRSSAFGIGEREAQYAEVKFSLEPNTGLAAGTELYLVGEFNQWMIDSRYRLQYDSTRSLWRGSAVIKQGVYAYKYVEVDGNTIRDLVLDRTFTKSPQAYLTFVYFRDPERNYDRLLQVDRLLNR